MPDHDPKDAPDTDAPEPTRRGPPKWDPGPSEAPDDGLAPRQGRRVYGREYRLKTSSGQQWVFIGLALLFVVGYFLFRQSCAQRVARTYEAVTDQPRSDAGAKRAIMLQVGGAFHSPLMETARHGLSEYLDSIVIKAPAKPVVANVTAKAVLDSEAIRDLLVRQVTAPVMWAQTMTYLKEQQVSRIIEIGPGKVLAGLAKRGMRPDYLINLDTLDDISTFQSVAV